MLSFKNVAFVLGALMAVSAMCAEAHFNLHGRNGLEAGVGLPGLAGAHIGLALPGLHGRQGGQHQPIRPIPPTPPTTTTGAPPVKCNCPVIPINRRCGPNCDKFAFQADYKSFKSAGCCVATPCQMRGNQADYDDFKSYVCSRNFNC